MDEQELTKEYLDNVIKTVIESDPPLCPCHKQYCVWTSYNQALWKEPKTDHYSCAVTKQEIKSLPIK